MKDRRKKVFWRIFKYVWPQWPRVVAIVATAVLIGILFSLSFATVIPLLKVMMGEEGLHGWLDRKTCDWRYGMDFDVPDMTDFIGGGDPEIAYYLLVTDVTEDGAADMAGIESHYQIIGVGDLLVGGDVERIASSYLLAELASAEAGSVIRLQARAPDEAGRLVNMDIDLHSPSRPSDMDTGQWSFGRRLEWTLKWGAIRQAQSVSNFLPRENARSDRRNAVIFIILLMAVVTTLRCCATFCQKYLGEKVVQIAITNLRHEFFSHVMAMPVGFFSQAGTSDTTSRIIGDTAGTGKGVKILLGKALREPLKAFFCLLLAMMISWQLTLIFLCAAPVTIALLGLLGKKMKKATKKSLISSALMLGKLQGTLNALRVVKVYNRQEHEVSAYDKLNKTFLRRALRIAKVQAATGPIMEILGMVAGSAALLVGVHWVFRLKASMDASSFFGLLLLLGTAAESIRKASDVWNRVQEANAAAERVYEILDRPAEYESPDASDLLPLRDKIEFKDVYFTYPGSETASLKGINLTIKAGQTVAIVGPNGSGKTTLVNLIPRFYNPDSGTICFDGQDIHEGTLFSLRNQIGMVTQNVVTFNDTIAANIGYGRDDVSRADIIDAAKRSYADEFISPLPDGYDTVIGEHGSGFSGGQLQRIVIARAVLRNPSILIFDEAMSQVDADSEAKIHSALSELMCGRTCLVIAHRFSTVISADTIVVTEEGRIVAQGVHNELIENCSLYRNLYETQLMAPQ